MKAVIFDLDGVITDTAQLHFKAWKKIAKKLNIFLTDDFNETLKGVDRMTSLERILEYGKLAENFSYEEKVALAQEKNDFYVSLLRSLSPQNILPGIKELLSSLKEHNIKIGLASASKNAPAILEYLKISDYFDTIVDPAILSKGKPDPEIFIRAAEQLEVNASDCVGIEDAYSGIKAINNANIVSVGVGESDVLQEADLVVSDTSLLNLELIQGVWGRHQQFEK